MQPGDLVGEDFELHRLAGSGGMGHVYEATDRRTDRTVAVKILKGDDGADAARFAREAQILTGLDHPHVVRFVTYGITGTGAHYLVMEWLDGEDLARRLSRAPLTVEQSVALAIRIAEALAFAHARGVVHRDLKPANIFLPGGRIEDAKVLDFGLAHLGGAGTRMTRSGAVLGTPGYMAPEQARGNERVGPESDVFSLGCVLYECLTGEKAFGGTHMVAVLTKILFDQTPRARDRCPQLPEDLDALLERMLSKNPAERPRDGAEVLAALRDLPPLSGEASRRAPPRDERPAALTGSEQRAVAVILIGTPPVPEGPALNAAETVVLGGGAALREEAARHGGQFEMLMGGAVAVVLSDSVMATDLAAQAARCALGLRRHAEGRPIALTMGRSEPTRRPFMGHAIDRAARLVGDGAAVGAPIVLDEVTAGLLDARFDVRVGDEGPTLHGERELGEGTRTLLGRATPCVGRERDLRVLEDLYSSCVDERVAQAVLVTAPPGVGKSRLGQELVRIVRARDEGAAVWIGRGDPLRVGSAFGLLGQAIRSACGIRAGEPLEVRRDKLVARVAEHVPEADRRRVAELLGEVIGAPFSDEDSPTLKLARADAQLMNDRMFGAFLDFISAECEAHPTLLVLEDLHWGDHPTVQFLDRALRERAESPLFVLALARPEVYERFPQLWAGRTVYDIRLNQLSKKASERLARHVLGERVAPGTLERLVRLSEGNAFYLEELIRATAEGKGADLPETVVAMVQSRLGGLDEASRRLLRAASVFGEVFWAGGVAALVGASERGAERLLDLAQRELVMHRAEGRFPGEEELAFRHALVREGAYGMLTEEDRTLGHRLAGEWLERRGEQDALVLAEHFERGGEGARAGELYLRAAQQAHVGGDADTTMAHAKRGLACPVPDDVRAALLGMICEASAWKLESLITNRPYAEQLLRLSRSGSAAWVQGMFVKLFSALQAGHVAEFLETLDELCRVEPSPEGVAPLVFAMATAAYILDKLGRIEHGTAVLAQVDAMARELGERDGSPRLWFGVIEGARSGYAHEDPWAGLVHSRDVLATGERLGYRRIILGAHVLAAMNTWFLGAREEAERTLTGLSLPDEELGHGSSLRPFCLAWMLAERGAFEDARAWAERMITSGRTRGLPVDEGRGHWVLAEVLRREGAFAAAETALSQAQAMLSMSSPLDYPGVLATRAALGLAQGRVDEALVAAEEGLRRSDAQGGCGYARGAFLRLVHAECLDAAGKTEETRAAIKEARGRLLASAERIGDPALRRSFVEAVPENARTFALAKRWLREG
ncbi:serine/threonine-protein kinase [Polyangium aurulentum]|uniref:serine/threonine-protein kinase n=1 Tax=Polyangium aurulentum TaxID=2567896 RepID=UPI0010AED637|nr:serine/threonine-protein kinase [Polyangium aurulentum]UQA56005.1 protein kinase [Polyangium aurulentum]